MNSQQLIKTLSWRYSAKAFDVTKKISETDYHALKESLRLSPSSYNIQPWLFMEIKSKEVLSQLALSAPFNKGKFETASHVIVMASLKKISPVFLEALYEQTASDNGIPREKLIGFEQMLNHGINSKTLEQQADWSIRQTYCALGMILSSAASLGIDACPMEGIDSAAFDSILGLDKSDYGSIVALALGYRSTEDKTQFGKKVRRSDVFRTL